MPTVTFILTDPSPQGCTSEPITVSHPEKRQVYAFIALALSAFARHQGIHPGAVQQSSVWREERVTPTPAPTYPAYHLSIGRWDDSGAVRDVSLYVEPCEGRMELVATYHDDEGELSRILALAAEQERTNPHDGQLPSEAAITRAILIDCGLDAEGEG